MLKFIVALLIGLSNLPKITPCVQQYNQCGGLQYTGPTDCCAPSICVYNNDYYSQCIPSTTISGTGCSAVYQQCGGQNWSGPTCCDYSTCTYSGQYYSQCLPVSSSSSSSSSTTSTTQSSTSTSSTTQSSTSTSSTTQSSTSTSSTTQSSTSTSSTTQSSTSASSTTQSSTSTSSSTTQSSGCTGVYSQCGGQNWSGSTCCIDSICTYSGQYYSQCLPVSSSSSSSSSTTSTTQSSTSTSSSTTQSSGCTGVYSQCGGQNWSGSTCCIDSICTYSGQYYSQCLPVSSSSSSSSSTTSTTQSSTSASSTTQSSTSTSSTTQSSTSTSSTTQSSTSTSSTTQSSTSTSSTTQSSTSTSSTTQSSTSTSSTTQSSTSTSSSTTQSSGCTGVYSQCGGQNWSGSTCCIDSICTYSGQYYSQCLPVSSSSSSGSTASSTTISVGNGGQAGVTTRYWDCCKPSCGWTGKASVVNPVETCAQDGVTPVDANTGSGCTGGSAYMCINQQPWSVSSSLSYGYAAAAISGQSESDWCCACYSLIFTDGIIAGKEMIVQVTNTGGDLGSNQFDLAMPGGGFGIFDGCLSQFPGNYSWGDTYGGVSQRSDCNSLPLALQSGCYWRFDWFQNANNPPISFQQVTCPNDLTANTQCIRL